MKLRLLIFFLITSLTSCSQTDKYAGEYYFIHDSSGMTQHYKLNLNLNGTFEFVQHWEQKTRTPGLLDGTESTGIEKGKGKWALANQSIVFTCDSETDINQDYRFDFDNTKARILNDSSIRFVESKMFWAENMELKKRI